MHDRGSELTRTHRTQTRIRCTSAAAGVMRVRACAGGGMGQSLLGGGH